MKEALKEFLEAGARLLDEWDEEQVKKYPAYLPSFDEFLGDFADLVERGRNARP